jgi:hypothetical protein
VRNLTAARTSYCVLDAVGRSSQKKHKKKMTRISMRRVGLCQVYTAKYPITIENVIISMRDITRTLRLCSFQHSFLFLESESERESERARERERERKHLCMLVVNIIETLPGLCPYIVSSTLAEPVTRASCVSICTFEPVKQVNSVPSLDRSHLSATAARLK